MNDNQNNIFSNFNQAPNNMPNQTSTPTMEPSAQSGMLNPTMPEVNESPAPSFGQFNTQSAVQTNPVVNEAPAPLQPEMPSVNTNPSPFDIGLNGETPSAQTPNSNTITPNVNTFNEPNTNMANTQAAPQQTMTSISVPVATVKQYMVHFLLTCIPLVGFIILIVRAFGNGTNKNISNLAKAQLLFAVIMTVLSIVLTFVLGSMLVGLGIGLA